jgi:hypothetical protein
MRALLSISQELEFLNDQGPRPTLRDDLAARKDGLSRHPRVRIYDIPYLVSRLSSHDLSLFGDRFWRFSG